MRGNHYKITRTFHPVGHGGFYTERFFNDFTMVYDCGAKQEQNVIKLIDIEFQENKVIDILFISHFHQDHISGLEHILKVYTVKCIVLPLLDVEEKIRTFLFNIDDGSTTFIQELSLDPEKTIKEKSKEDIKIVLVSSENGNNEINIDDLPTTIKSGDRLVYAQPRNIFKWCYKPFNFFHKERSNELKNLFIQRGIPWDVKKLLNFYKVNKANKDSVKEAYKEVEGNLNTNSLVVYSGLFSKIKTTGYCKRGYSPEKFYMRHDKAGCLYLGDYNAQESDEWNALEAAYTNYFQYLSIIQIPHHGSKDNYNEKLNNQNNLLSIISAPLKENKNHPSAEVIKNIVLNNGIPIVVTEDEQSKFIQTISFPF